MTFTRTLYLTSAFALVASGPAFADLTAEQVLADQLLQMEFYGFDVETIAETRVGDTLTVSGLTATGDMPEGALTMTMGGATYTEQGDGTVVVSYPDEIPVSIDVSVPDEDNVKMAMMLKQKDTTMVVSGTPEAIRYEFNSDEFTIDNIAIISPEEAAELDFNIAVSLSNLVGTMEFSGRTVRDYTATYAVGALTALIEGTDPEAGGKFKFALDVADFSTDYTGKAVKQDLNASLSESIDKGLAVNAKATHGAARYGISFDGPDGAFEGDFTIGSGDLEFEMDSGGMDYQGTNRDLSVTFGGSMIPFPPMTIKMAESGGRFAMPIIPSDDAQDFGLRMTMVDLVLDPILWAMFDPAEQLPRDPATLVIDLDGQAVMNEDIFDPAYAEQFTGAPGQINSANVNELRLTVAGAELTGDGAFTFNNEGPIPMPSGVANLMLKGSNSLLDTLVAMGLLPQEQAMGARMMMGLFARPGEGEDTLVSTIELNEDGSILANGQRIK